MKLRLAALALLAILLVPAVAFASPVIVYEGWGTPSQPLKARPGYSDYPFTVQVSGIAAEYGELNLTGLPFTNATYGSVARAFPESESPLTLVFYLDVNRGAEPGVYDVPMKLFLQNGSAVGLTVQAVVSRAPEVAVAQAYWASPAYPGSGEQELILVAENPTGDPVSLVAIRVSLADGVYNATGGSVAYAYIEGIEPHSFYQASLPLNISSSASPGTYRFNYTATFYDAEGVEYSSSGSFQVYIAPRPSVAASLSGLQLVPGEEGTLNVTVKNEGSSPVYDVYVELSVSGLELVGGNSSAISYLGPGSSAELRYTVYAPPQLPAGAYPVVAAVSYEWQGVQQEVTEVGQAYVLSQSPIQVSASPSYVIYDRNNTVTLTVTNELNCTITGVRAYVSAPQGAAYIYSEPGWISLGPMAPGSSRSIELSVLPFSQAQIIPLEVSVSYQGQLGAPATYSQEVELFVEGMPQVSITQLSAPPATNGSSETISGTLLNSGTAGAYYGTITLVVPGLGVNESEYIGDLPTDSPTPFSFAFQVPASASGTYQARLIYTYQDQYGNTYTAQASAQILVSVAHSARQARSLPYFLAEVLAAALAAGVAVGYAAGRARRK